MAENDWFPTTKGGQNIMFTNVLAKIGGYQATLSLTAGQVAEIEGIAQNHLSIQTFVDSAQATMDSLYEWQRDFAKGSPVGDALPAAPIFAVLGAIVGMLGSHKRFRELREIIVAAPGYTQAIGEDMKIVKIGGGPVPEGTVAPDLTVTALSGFKIKVAGSMQKTDQIIVQYRRNGGDWIIGGSFTTLPAEFTVTPQTPGQPEVGVVRAFFQRKNVQFGNFSPEYPVTVS